MPGAAPSVFASVGGVGRMQKAHDLLRWFVEIVSAVRLSHLLLR
jgi:hypothetical protein